MTTQSETWEPEFDALETKSSIGHRAMISAQENADLDHKPFTESWYRAVILAYAELRSMYERET